MGIFKKDPIKVLQKEYEAKMLEARNVQRSGDIQKYSLVNAEAEELFRKIENLKKDKK